MTIDLSCCGERHCICCRFCDCPPWHDDNSETCSCLGAKRARLDELRKSHRFLKKQITAVEKAIAGLLSRGPRELTTRDKLSLKRYREWKKHEKDRISRKKKAR